jgi:cytosine/adenosine deaminase-related metal-dependent hydrolase
MLFDGAALLAADSPQAIGSVPGAVMIERPASVLIPPLVNAHAHLDLTEVGRIEVDASTPDGFAAWLAEVRRRRPSAAQDIRSAVRRGAELSVRGGVGWVGDIAGLRSLDAFAALAESPLAGVSFLEVFGLCGAREADAISFIESLTPRRVDGVSLGLQPHALYSAGDRVFAAALRSGLAVSTHLAESAAEAEFATRLTGPLARLVREVGAWSDELAPRGARPAAWFSGLARHAAGPVVAAHVNDVADDELASLRDAGVAVAYCPRSNAFFGRPGPAGEAHRWREMLAMGITVAIGTDSLASLSRDDRVDRLSPLDELALLRRRGGATDAQLLRMATLDGLRALGLPEDPALFTPGPKRGWLAVRGARGNSDLGSIFDSDSEVEWIVGPHKVAAPG